MINTQKEHRPNTYNARDIETQLDQLSTFQWDKMVPKGTHPAMIAQLAEAMAAKAMHKCYLRWLKFTGFSSPRPHQGKQEMARRVKQQNDAEWRAVLLP